MQMDPQIKLLAAMKRELTKIVNKGRTAGDKAMLIEFGERTLKELRGQVFHGMPAKDPDPVLDDVRALEEHLAK